MEKNLIFGLSDYETNLIKEINEIFKYDFPECDLLEYTFVNIKLQGAAYLLDIMNISSLGIPIFSTIANKRGEALSSVVHQLKTGSINFYEVREALQKFLS